MESLEERRKEFRSFVWDHSIDAFQAQFDERRNLSNEEICILTDIFVAALKDPDLSARKLLSESKKNDDILALTLQVCGLTRNKILQDLKASAVVAKDGIAVPGSYSRLPYSSAWPYAGAYIVARVRKVMQPFADQSADSMGAAIQSLNQATWPGYIRQERAKRSGHEAEYRLATLMYNFGVPFEPRLKSENPLCPDAQLNGISFDLVVPSLEYPKILVKSTVHTANIGQYGESKDDLEIKQARSMINDRYSDNKPILLAFADGVGFYSNRSGLDGVLSGADEFCQFRTIWKAIVIALMTSGRKFRLLLPATMIPSFEPFLNRWECRALVSPIEGAKLDGTELEVGDALLSA